jgi:hypothetical protein
VVLLSCVGAVIGLRLAMALHWPLPFCLLRKVTGVPCPACGSTRSLLAWTHLDPVTAFHYNPLFCIGLLLGGAWLLLGLVDGWTGRGWATEVERGMGKLPLIRILVALAALNWVYLCFNLPK